MTLPTVLVTAATGRTGTPITRLLLERGVPVRALVHRDDARTRALAAGGAQIVVGSLEDLDAVRRATAGVQRAYFTAPFTPWALQAAANLAIAAQEHHLEAIVVMSQWLAHPTHPSAHTRNSWLADRLLAWMPDVATVTINPGFFADNYLAALEAVAQFGMLTMPLGHGRNAPPSNDDLARVAATLLTDPGPHLGNTYRPTGPDLLDPDGIADSFARGLDRPVRYRDTPFAMLAKVAHAIGYSDYAIEQLRWYIQDYQADAFAVAAPTDVVATLTGRDPEPFHTIVRTRAQAEPRTRRTPGNLAHALTTLTKAMTAPGPNLRRLTHVSQLPHGNNYLLATDSPEWTATHTNAHSAL